MRQLHCPACRESIFFEHGRCGHCGASLAFDPVSLEFRGNDDQPVCANRSLIGCNWAAQADNGYCISCSLTRTIPVIQQRNVVLWRRAEQAKRRLLYDLARLRLPLSSQAGDRHIVFDILAEDGSKPVMTGHLRGLITLSLSEADDVEREARRMRFREPYRTLLGHFRHEVGHFYWDLLVDGTKLQRPFRLIFGDETADYKESIERYHARGDRPYDRTAFISEYATSHPWEDWAETFAHFLHIVSTLDSASSLPLSLDRRLHQTLDDPYMEGDFEALLASWSPVAYTINELNRSMGLSDAYPFELSAVARGKLHFVHMAVLNFREQTSDAEPPARSLSAVGLL
ncbi:zinc-binding metallopeptidase family protein [Bradyrhizobium sp.]|uniref:zinc-binding metallopeptidase family protein n=1 Tax=Bradyrhizobium sp. TaxID=376 RepID=UPI001D54F8C7|nr:putative zinc-binding metallopeptidase [Bradyrhizobium sp.]MBV8697729.1 putative zinc-binding metallopeptidase [Bradyrhizobium sp.]MBV8920294.1 putative zinc-binding metallopeptidase [Bradyrhizobium sp.]MBV9980236.1 putative zinc-binding metallopeptidase [Bradyrhizobium sp.]